MKSKLLYPVLVSFLISILLVAALPAGIPAIASGDTVTSLPQDGLPEKGNPKPDSRLNQFVSAQTPEEVSFFNPTSGTDVTGAISISSTWAPSGNP
jgi:hypothetical protein